MRQFYITAINLMEPIRIHNSFEGAVSNITVTIYYLDNDGNRIPQGKQIKQAVPPPPHEWRGQDLRLHMTIIILMLAVTYFTLRTIQHFWKR